jgi:endonuclease G
VCGPINYRTPKYGYIGKTFKIRIPDAFFKVVLTGVQSGNPRAIGFIYKNEAGNNKRDKYVNSVDEVERITNIDFFASLPDKIESKVESIYNLNDWK